MHVELLAYTPESDKLSAAAAMGCTDPRPAYELLKGITNEIAGVVLDIVIPSGHHSVIEHANFTFSVEGVSRSLTHQLVRHRIASYSQQSQRYVRFDKPDFVTPPKVERNEYNEKIEGNEDIEGNDDDGCSGIFRKAMEKAWDSYNKLIDAGIPDEDARYVLPNAAKNNITITMNARELLHFFCLRCCTRAQWEIRELAMKMLPLVKEVAPKIFENAGATCDHLGYCPEEKSCGRSITLKELKSAAKEQVGKKEQS